MLQKELVTSFEPVQNSVNQFNKTAKKSFQTKLDKISNQVGLVNQWLNTDKLDI